MRIVRYELAIIDFQQVQPLWPGTIVGMKPGRLLRGGREISARDQVIDLWCIDDSSNTPNRAPILGIYVIGTGNPMPPDMVNPMHGNVEGHQFDGGPLAPGVRYVDTAVMADGLVWHVFTRTLGLAAAADTGFGEVSSVDDIAEQVAERQRQRAAGYGVGTGGFHG